MGKILQTANKNILQHRHGAPKITHPGAKVGLQTQRTMQDFRKSLMNQVPAQIQGGLHFCGPNAPQFCAAQRKEAVDKAAFASICGVSDAEYYEPGIPLVFNTSTQEVIQVTGPNNWYCTEHKLVLNSKQDRFNHWRKFHRNNAKQEVGVKKNGQFKRNFNTKSFRSMQNRAKAVYSDGEYERLLDERPTYAGDLPLMHRRCPSVNCGRQYPKHQTVQHFDVMKIQKIDDQINQMLRMAGSELHDHGHDNDDDTQDHDVLRAMFAAKLHLENTVEQASDLLREARARTDSMISEGAAYKYSTDKELSLEAIVLDGMHQVTPVFGAQFYQTYGGDVANIERSPDWQPDSVSQINLPGDQADSVSHIVEQSEYYADVSDKRVSSNQSMLD